MASGSGGVNPTAIGHCGHHRQDPELYPCASAHCRQSARPFGSSRPNRRAPTSIVRPACAFDEYHAFPRPPGRGGHIHEHAARSILHADRDFVGLGLLLRCLVPAASCQPAASPRVPDHRDFFCALAFIAATLRHSSRCSPGFRCVPLPAGRGYVRQRTQAAGSLAYSSH